MSIIPKLLNEGSLVKPACRTCGEEHDMSFATGKFCSYSCSSAYSALKNRATLGDYKPQSLGISDEEKAYKKAKDKGIERLSEEELHLAESFIEGTDKDLSKRDKFIELEPSHEKKFSKADFIEYFSNQRHSLSKKNSFRRCQELLAFNTVPTVEELKILNAFNKGNKWLLVGDNFVFNSKRSLNPDPEKSDLLNKANEESIRLGVPWCKTPTGKILNSETHRKAANELIAKGLHKGWSSRGKGLMSYPEKYWKGVLDNLQLSYVQEFVINRRSDLYLENKANFFCDFLLVSPKGHLIDLEIDGKQHNYPEREATDLNRCLELKESFRDLLGEPFYIYRVPWVNPLDEESKSTVREQVRAFEEFYRAR